MPTLNSHAEKRYSGGRQSLPLREQQPRDTRSRLSCCESIGPKCVCGIRTPIHRDCFITRTISPISRSAGPNCSHESGGNYRQMEADGLFAVVVKAECVYHRPARYDDVLTIHTLIKRLTPAKIEHEYIVYRDEERLATAQVALTRYREIERE